MPNLVRIRQCADHNQEVLQAIIHNSLHMFENMEYGERVRLQLNYLVCRIPKVYTQIWTIKAHFMACGCSYSLFMGFAISRYVLFFVSKEDLRKVHPVSTFDMDKLKSTIKQFVRDWSEVGQAERDSCYYPIIQEIQKIFPSDI